LRCGDRATIACVAVSPEQGCIVSGYVKASLLEPPILAPPVERIDDSGCKIALSDIDIVVLSGNYRSLRRRSISDPRRNSPTRAGWLSPICSGAPRPNRATYYWRFQ